MLEALAELLRETRQARGISLEAVARPAKISAPYLLKLERAQVTSPSPRVLARLAVVLGVPYLRLLELAGYLDEEAIVRIEVRTPEPHPLADQELTSAEWRDVGAFIRRLIAQRP
jgi:transcriptional regulator with XRE-family HTH domain